MKSRGFVCCTNRGHDPIDVRDALQLMTDEPTEWCTERAPRKHCSRTVSLHSPVSLSWAQIDRSILVEKVNATTIVIHSEGGRIQLLLKASVMTFRSAWNAINSSSGLIGVRGGRKLYLRRISRPSSGLFQAP